MSRAGQIWPWLVGALVLAACAWVGPWPEFEQQIYEGRARYVSAAWAGEREAEMAKKRLSPTQIEALLDACDDELGLVFEVDHNKRTLVSLARKRLIGIVGGLNSSGVRRAHLGTSGHKKTRTSRVFQITDDGVRALALHLCDFGAPKGAGKGRQ